MSWKSRKQNFAACGGIVGASYLAANNCACVPDFVMGLALGLGLVLLALSLLPEEKLRKLEALKPWRHRG